MNQSAHPLWQEYINDPSEALFTRFYEATSGYVYTICYRILGSDEEEALDAFQATYVKLVALAQNREEAVKVDNIDVLVRRLAVREADRRRKRRSRHGQREIGVDFVENLADATPAADQVSSERQIRGLIERLVDSLPETYRLPVQLHFFDGLTHQEIAESLGMARSSVTKTIHKALQRLEPMFRRAGLGEGTSLLLGGLVFVGLLEPPSSVAATGIFAEARTALSSGSGSGPSITEILQSSTTAPTLSPIGGLKGLLVAATAVVGIIGVSFYIGKDRPDSIATPSAPVATSSALSGSIAGGPGDTAALPSGGTGASISAQSMMPGTSLSGAAPTLSLSGNLDAYAASFLPPVVWSDLPTTGPRLVVAGRVLLEDGNAAPVGTRVRLVWRDNAGTYPVVETIDQETSTGLDGSYVVEGIDRSGLVIVARSGVDLRGETPVPNSESVDAASVDTAKVSPDHQVTCDVTLRVNRTISGLVVNNDQSPLSGAGLRAVGKAAVSPVVPWPLAATATADGRFFLEVPQSVSFPVQVVAQASGYSPGSWEIPEPVDGVVLRLTPGGVQLQGHVFLKSTGEGVEKAAVRLVALSESSASSSLYPPFEAIADADGEFLLKDLPSGTLALEAEKGDLRTLPLLSPLGCRVDTKPGESREGISLLLRETHFLAGRVTDPFENPLDAVKIEILSASGELRGTTATDAEGRYRLEELPSGLVQVVLTHSDYPQRLVEGVEVDRVDAHFILEPTRRVTLVGRVIDSGSLAPVKALSVTGSPEMKISFPGDTAGQFLAEDLVPGQTVRFRIESSDYPALVTESIAIPTNAEGRMERTFELGPSGEIVGRVISVYTREPLPEIPVQLVSAEAFGDEAITPVGSVQTDAMGRFRFEGVSKGKYKVKVHPTSPWVGQSVATSVRFGITNEVADIALNRMGTIRGRVVRLPGETGVPNEEITLVTNYSPERAHSLSNANGEFEFTNLPYLYYMIVVRGRDSMAMIVSLDQADTRDVVVPIGSTRLSGRVFRNGQPCGREANVRVLSIDIPDFTRAVVTNADGYYSLDEMSPGRWKVQVTYRPARMQTVTEYLDVVDGQAIERDFTLPSGRVVGQVVDEDSRPVGSARVAIRKAPQGEDVGAAPTPLQEQVVGPTGTFAFEGLAPGHYEVSAAHSERTSLGGHRVDIPFEGETDWLQLQLGKGASGSLVSIVYCLSSGDPLPEAWCQLTRLDPTQPTILGKEFLYEAQRDKNGAVEIQSIPEGLYLAQVSAFGYSVSEHQVVIRSGQMTTVEDVLYEAGALRWTLKDHDGRPLQGVQCRLSPVDPTSIEKARQGVSSANGMWVCRGLYPGHYTATATVGKETITETVTIHAHDVTEQVTQVPLENRLSAQVAP